MVLGKVIKARTLNQRKIIDSVHKNDMVFAIGPAGTGKTTPELHWLLKL